ncbi:MAG: ABC transporter substrate-binding protein [Devosia sp.]|uniref:ABC transporter substrate-binding protein n=1 Tax=Devosia sp. TaxID=1871048 RepID=UPI001A4DEA8C|nr:ABC transporter substrate-binding protein [Devosia sp.]MBL8600265.1 ABC transporter substrate-binding protein [Devosia sp.]
MGASIVLGATSFAWAQDLPDVPRDRTLISAGWFPYAQVQAPDNFNPYGSPLLNLLNNLQYTVYEPLFYVNQLSGEVKPWLAEEYAYNSDFTEVTLKLRNDVKWSDGESFSADDVIFTVNMLLKAAPAISQSAAFAEWVSSVEAKDEQTVVFKLKKPGPRWARDFLAASTTIRLVVVPKHIWDGQDPATFANFDLQKGWPVGTGAYRLVKADSNSLYFDRKDEWWAVAAGRAEHMPEVQRIVYAPATIEALPQLYATNAIDVGRSIQPGTFEAIRAQNPNLTAWNKEGPVWGAPDGCVFAIFFNNQTAPFDNPVVRHAINYAIDRDQYVNLAWEGSVKKAVLPFSSYALMVPYTDSIAKLGLVETLDNHDQTKVDELMTSAGYSRNGDGFWTDGSGKTLQVALEVAQGDPSAPVLVEQFRSAGFDALFHAQPTPALLEAIYAGNFQMTVRPQCGSSYDPWQTLQYYHSKYVAPVGSKIPSIDAISRFGDEKLDAVLDKMEAKQPSIDDPDYVSLVNEAVGIFAEDLPAISLAEEFHTLPFNTTYWTGFPSADDPYQSPYLVWAPFAQVVAQLKPRE